MLRVGVTALLIFSLVFSPQNAIALNTKTCTFDPSNGPIGTLVKVNGNLTVSTPVNVLFQNVSESSATTNSTGLFAVVFFVPPVLAKNYTISVQAGGNSISCVSKVGSLGQFQVTFGTDTLDQMRMTIIRINNSLNTLSSSFKLLQANVTNLQTQLNDVKNNLTFIRSLIPRISSNLTSAQAQIFGVLNGEINAVNQSISSLSKQVVGLSANLTADRTASNRQEQLSLISIITTAGVGAVVLVVIQFGSRRKKRPGIDNWDVFD